MADQASRLARSLSRVDLGVGATSRSVQNVVTPEVAGQRIGMVQVYRAVRVPNQPIDVVLAWSTSRRRRCRRAGRAARPIGWRRAPPAAKRRRASRSRWRRAAMLKHVAHRGAQRAAARSPAWSWPAITCPGDLAERARRMSKAYEDYTQLRVLKQPLAGVYVSFFVMVTLLILVGSTWMGLYLAKRITRPVQMLSEAAREIGAGHYDHRIEHEGSDEFGSMVEAFNAMAAEVAQSRRRLERASIDLERKHDEGEGRRRYIEAILERIATGVVSIDRGGPHRHHQPVGAAAAGVDRRRDRAAPRWTCSRAPDLAPVNDVLDQAARAKMDSFAQEVALVRDGRERHVVGRGHARRRHRRQLRRHGAGGRRRDAADSRAEGRGLARGGAAAGARNQESADADPAVGRAAAPQAQRRRRRRCRSWCRNAPSTIIGEVESLKGLVDEFSQFARMPAPRAVPTDLHALLQRHAGALRRPVRRRSSSSGTSTPASSQVRLDPEQMKRVMINLIDNAIEAMGRAGHDRRSRRRATSRTASCASSSPTPAPAFRPAERDKLFLPYYSTKGRGSGLGLAIVRRIVAEHGGSIDVTDNVPTGTRFIIELPA